METIDYQEFELQLQKMKEGLESNIARLREEMNSIVSEDEINDLQDLASLQSDSMHHTALLKQQQYELDEVIHALSKIKNGTYGICEDDGDMIPVERLRAEPHTRYCLEGAIQAEK
ncbi:MAG: TraR/DksA C4-type zinc finger protein [Campylobacterota bacterium]|nr:TraR/DksA C4-type zinc finger protein [Campylobacterota bacterium]